MSEPERVVSDEKHAQHLLDAHFRMNLGCTATDMRRPGWTILTSRSEADAGALLFGRRTLLQLLVPVNEDDPRGLAPRSGVALVAGELRDVVVPLLREYTPDALFDRPAVAVLDAVLRRYGPRELTPLMTAWQQIRYTYAGAFRPYLGQWLDWIEPLDEAHEMASEALSLLARFGQGVYVIRDQGGIAAYGGMRAQSPHTWEVTGGVPSEALRGHKLGRAVISRATRAVLASGRVPFTAIPSAAGAAGRVADVLGYRMYAEALIYVVDR